MRRYSIQQLFASRTTSTSVYVPPIGRVAHRKYIGQGGNARTKPNYGRYSWKGCRLWVDELNEVVAIDGSSVIAVFDDDIRFSRLGSGVEFDLAYNAVKEMKRNLSKDKILLEELKQAKELLYIDYRGISAVKSFDDTVYMDITATKIAGKIAERE